MKDGVFSVSLPVDTVMTITTLTGQEKGSFSGIPPSAPFPIPYSDDFDSRDTSISLAYNCHGCIYSVYII